MQQQKPIQLKVSLDRTLALNCEECGSSAFQEAFMLRKVSKFLTGESQDGIVPIATFVCVKCGHINKEFYPREIADIEKRTKDEEEKADKKESKD